MTEEVTTIMHQTTDTRLYIRVGTTSVHDGLPELTVTGGPGYPFSQLLKVGPDYAFAGSYQYWRAVAQELAPILRAAWPHGLRSLVDLMDGDLGNAQAIELGYPHLATERRGPIRPQLAGIVRRPAAGHGTEYAVIGRANAEPHRQFRVSTDPDAVTAPMCTWVEAFGELFRRMVEVDASDADYVMRDVERHCLVVA